MLKTNVVKKQYHLLSRNDQNIECAFSIEAESLESAKLKLPNDFRFEKELSDTEVKNCSLHITVV